MQCKGLHCLCKVLTDCVTYVKIAGENTLEAQFDRDENPKSQHFMFTYDEMMLKPHSNINNISTRERSPTYVFLCPEDIVVRELEKTLISVYYNELDFWTLVVTCPCVSSQEIDSNKYEAKSRTMFLAFVLLYQDYVILVWPVHYSWKTRLKNDIQWLRLVANDIVLVFFWICCHHQD